MKKQRKRKNNQTKERKEWFYITPRADSNPKELALTYHPDTDTFSVQDRDDFTITHVVSHERESGKDKTISSAIIKNEFFSGKSFDQHIRESHEYLLAIDTNTIKIEENLFVSACCSYTLDHKIEKGREEYPYNFLCSFLIIHENKETKIEPFGWHLVLEKFLKKTITQNKKIGVIVDSDLNLIHDMNERKIPYYKNHILPKEYTLIYSSSDKKDHIGNQLIAMCDKGANLILNLLKNDNNLEKMLSLNLPVLDGFRYVEARGKKETK